MTTAPDSGGAGRREVRLLLVTIVIAAVALLLLAQFRFPDQPAARAVSATPALERLAARATFGELAGIIADVQRRIEPALLGVRIRPDHTLPLVPLDSSEIGGTTPRFTTAVRIDSTTALISLPPGARADGLVTGGAAEVVAADEVRGLAVLRVPGGAATIPRNLNPDLDLPAYVALAESSATGVTVRPVFVPRADATTHSSWPGAVLALGGLGLLPGALVFSLDGEFLGLVAPNARGPMLVPAAVLIAHAGRLQRDGSVRRGAFGFSVQALTAAVAAATGASAGVVVTFVAEDGPSAELRVGDVIVSAQGEPIIDVQTFAAVVGEPEAGQRVRLEVLRQGHRHLVEFSAAETGPATAAPEVLGLTLRALRGIGSEVVAVSPDGGAARAGLRTGDVITHLNGTAAPRPVDLEQAWGRRDSAPALLGVQRGAVPLVLAFGQP
jgi:S1-C subfamily serine protease